MRRLLFPLGVALLGCDVKEPVPDRPVATSALVLVRPLGEVDARVVDSAAQAIRVVHGLRVMVAAPVTLPLEAWTNVRTPRYRADTLISWLRATKPDSVDLIVGITDQDISITKYDAEGKVKEPVARYRDFGIYGLGYMGGPSCVVSTFRLGAGATLFARLAKVVVHEVGHTRGLPHCADTLCVMRDAVERMSTVDGAGRRLCARCRDLLR